MDLDACGARLRGRAWHEHPSVAGCLRTQPQMPWDFLDYPVGVTRVYDWHRRTVDDPGTGRGQLGPMAARGKRENSGSETPFMTVKPPARRRCHGFATVLARAAKGHGDRRFALGPARDAARVDTCATDATEPHAGPLIGPLGGS